MEYNVVQAVANHNRLSTTRPLWQYDSGITLQLTGVTLPAYYEAHFSNQSSGGTSTTMLGNEDGVEIPDALLETGLPVYAWVYIHTGEDDGETVYEVMIPVKARPERESVDPTPEQQDAIEQAISALNDAVEETQYVIETAEGFANEAETSAVNAAASEHNASVSETNAHDSMTAAQTAKGLAEDARDDAISAKTQALSARTQAQTAKGKAEDAQTAAETAQGKAEDAQRLAESAQTGAESAKESADADALKAEGYSIGYQNGEPVESGTYYHNNAKYFKEQASGYADNASGSADAASGSASSAEAEALKSEGYASGKQNGTNVGSGSPYYHNNAKYYSQLASGSATAAGDSAEDAEAYAKGTRGGTAVESDDPAYHNNSKYYSEQAADSATSAATSAATFETDATLSVAGKAADAKKTGDEVTDLKSHFYDSLPTDTASGAIASFPDGADGIPVKDLTVQIEPVQDLHGYDNPWPAGGGKNKLSMSLSGIKSINTSGTWSGNTYTLNGVTFSVNTDDVDNIIGIQVSGTASAESVFKINSSTMDSLEVGSSYILSGCPSGGSENTYCLFINYVGIDSGAGHSFTASSAANRFCAISIKSGVSGSNKIFYPMVRLSSISDATFAPYSNLCPITGWTGVDVYDDPKYGGTIEWNQLIQNGDFSENEKWGNNGNHTTMVIANKKLTLTITDKNNNASFAQQSAYASRIYKDHVYCCIGTFTSSESTAVRIGFAGDTSSPIKYFPTIQANTRTTVGLINKITSVGTTGSHYYYPNTSGGLSVGATFVAENLMVFDLTEMFGTSIADYIYSLEQATTGAGVTYFRNLFGKSFYAYNSGTETCVSAVNGDPYRHIPISWQSEAGTVYGGYVNKETGKLVATYAYKNVPLTNFAYNESINCLIEYAAYNTFQNAKAPANNNTKFNAIADSIAINSASAINGGSSGIGITTAKDVYLRVSGLTSKAEYLATFPNGINVAYELATPVEYNLSDLPEITTLYGDNNIWADCGDTTVDYRADTKLYIQKMLS